MVLPEREFRLTGRPGVAHGQGGGDGPIPDLSGPQVVRSIGLVTFHGRPVQAPRDHAALQDVAIGDERLDLAVEFPDERIER